MFEILSSRPSNGKPRVFVTIHKGIGGWNSSVWGWTELDDGKKMNDGSTGFYEPRNTGCTNTIGDGKRESAIREATSWARDEELPLWIPEGDSK